MTNGQIVIDPLSSHYKQDPDRVFNLITHETFHLGYGYNRELRREKKLDDDFVYNTVLDGLQNEGIATYVGYRAREIFPNNDEPDYVMLEDPATVRRKLEKLNKLFGLIGTVSVDSLRGLAWDEGVMGRAYYVVGAHMARTIDEERGREALVETIAVGPLSFVDVYNEIADPDMRILATE
jgi:hypothetical protein